jgi:hypothetical protein
MIHWNQLGTAAMPWYFVPYNGVSWCNCSSQPFCRFSDVKVVEAIFKTKLCVEFVACYLVEEVRAVYSSTGKEESRNRGTA